MTDEILIFVVVIRSFLFLFVLWIAWFTLIKIFFFRFSIKWKIKMSPISGQERTKKYRSMMLEQKKRYVSEKDSERKREERKKIKLLLKQLEKWQKDKLCQQKRREVLKQINSPDVLEESLLKERRKTEKFRKKCSLSNSRRHCRREKQYHYITSALFCQRDLFCHIKNCKDMFKYICFALYFQQTVNNWESAIVFIGVFFSVDIRSNQFRVYLII